MVDEAVDIVRGMLWKHGDGCVPGAGWTRLCTADPHVTRTGYAETMPGYPRSPQDLPLLVLEFSNPVMLEVVHT